MKNYLKYYFGLIASCLVIASGCTDLVQDELDSEIQEAAGQFSGDPTVLLNSAYGKMLDAITQHERVFAFNEVSSDEAIVPTRGTDWDDAGQWRDLHTHSWDSSHPFMLPTWNNLNEGSYICNQVLAVNPSPEQAAEARYLRALYMSYIMDLWGVVPFREVNDPVTLDPKVFSRTEAFQFILDDINAALPNLPSIGPGATNVKASKAGAYALLAKLYINKAVYESESPAGPYAFNAADLNKVVEYVDAITAEGYKLSDDYFQIFTANAESEVILASDIGSPENRWFMTLHYDNNPGGWNGFSTLSEFYDKFDASDSRRGGSGTSGLGEGFLIGQQYDSDGEIIINSRNQQPLAFVKEVPINGATTDQGIRVIKYHPERALNYVVFRYADVLLLKAEAILRGASASSGGDALALVNSLREKRGVEALTSLDESALLAERGREMYWEGWRRQDQIRFGTYNEAWQEKSASDPFRVLLPIPRQAIDTNPNFEQNDGY